MNAGNLQRIERLNYLLGGVAVIVCALTQPQRFALGIAVGVALTCLNFFFLRRLVHRWTSDAAKGSSGGAMLVFPKMIGLMLAVILSLAFLPIDPIGFAIGYSIFVASIAVEIVISVVMPPHDSTTTDNDQEPHHG